MGVEHFIAFNLTLLAAIASPGPSLLFLARTTMAEGRAAGIAAAFGLGLMAAVWTAAALLGLDALFRVFPWAYLFVKTIGAAYLIWIAVQMWRHARTPVTEGNNTARSKFFRQGLLINLGNPKSVVFSAAVLVVIFPPELIFTHKALIFGNHLVVEWIVQPTLAILLSTEAVRRRYLGAKVITDRVAASVLGALGLRLLADRSITGI
ncbi:LysE family translocator [Rhodobacteraceae bacterium]|nr:LysE family translocator [Paracoccaceae bacterium]